MPSFMHGLGLQRFTGRLASAKESVPKPGSDPEAPILSKPSSILENAELN